MKVKLLMSRSGAGFAQSRGEIVDLPDDEAKRMIAAGQCEPVTTKETATKKPITQKAIKA